MSIIAKPYNEIKDLIYTQNWVEDNLNTIQSNFPNNSLYLLFENQEDVYSEIKSILPLDNLIKLNCNNIEKVKSILLVKSYERVVFISKSRHTDEIQDDNINLFLKLLQLIANFPNLALDIVTLRAIKGPDGIVVTHPADAAYIGLGQTFAKESPHIKTSCFSLSKFNTTNFLTALSGQHSHHGGAPIVIQDRKAFTAKMLPKDLILNKASQSQQFKHRGTYLIIGGTGGIGGLLAEHLASTYQANLIILGRRSTPSNLLTHLRNLGASGVTYEAVDICDKASLLETFARLPEIDGIVHSALSLEDSLLANMSEKSLLNVLKPKLHGVQNLALAIKNRRLDFILFFSSIQSYIANAGQGNYTAACACKDAYADFIGNFAMINTKVINWGYWGNLGIVASQNYRDRMGKLEIGSIEASEGLGIIEAFLSADEQQITAIKASVKALTQMNIEPRPPQAITKENPQTIANIVPSYNYEKLEVIYNQQAALALDQYARYLTSQLLLPGVCKPKYTKLLKAIQAIPPAQKISKANILDRFPQVTAHVKLLELCIENIPAILNSQKDPLEVLFPAGRLDLVQAIYSNNAIADYYNHIVSDIIVAFQKKFRKNKISILEIGAGTGSTTNFILNQSSESIEKYTFSDLSHSFLSKARTRFAAFDKLEYKIIDISKTDKLTEKYDVIVATNVIHATANIDQSLSNINNLLTEDGIVILNEITERQNFATLTFGLTDGWWLNNDPYRIPNSPLLAGETWEKLLLQNGFSEVVRHGGSEQQVLVATPMVPLLSEPIVPQITTVEKNIPLTTLATIESDPLAIKVRTYIKGVISKIMQINPTEFDEDETFKDMGIDSLITLELIQPFREDLGPIPATVMFEYPSISELADYFTLTYREKLELILAKPVAPIVPPSLPQPHVAEEVAVINNSSASSEYQQALKLIKQTIADVMCSDKSLLDESAPFVQFGIDSLISLELLKPLRQHYGQLASTSFFEYPSIAQLAEHLATTKKHKTNQIADSFSPKVPEGLPVNRTKTRELDKVSLDQVNLSPSSFEDEHIAIVGMAGKLPKAKNLDEFWELLYNGQTSTSDIPNERWSMDGFLKEDSPLNGGSYTKQGSFLSDIDAFDNEFFKITPTEAKKMDPQERLFLENTYHVIQDAGYSINDLKNSRTGVYVGVMNSGYSWHTPTTKEEPHGSSLFWSIANRTSYFYNWHGPSMAIDTACSASLSALHTACQALKLNDCKQAIVGGVNLIVHPRQMELLCGMHMLSKTDICRPFGQGADGFVDGEGITGIMIKKYQDAVADNDRIYAVIRSTSVNSGGRSNGYSAPNGLAQSQLIQETLAKAKVSPAEVGYIEAHGTGTDLGDPIEVHALNRVFKDLGSTQIPFGSVKSNIGHLESAAGLSGLIKVVLQMKNKLIVSTLNADVENTKLNLNDSPLYINKTNTPWSTADRKISVVSSFGAGGSNASAIIESYDAAEIPVQQHDHYLIPLSHNTAKGLQKTIDALRLYLQSTDIELDKLAYSLAASKDHFPLRVCYLVKSKDELIKQLTLDPKLATTKTINHNSPTKVNFSSEVSLSTTQANELEKMAVDYCAGLEIPWKTLFPTRLVHPLPPFPFDNNRFWITSKESKLSHPSQIVADHSINLVNIAPAAWIISKLHTNQTPLLLKDVTWHRPIFDINDVKTRLYGHQLKVTNKLGNKIYVQGTQSAIPEKLYHTPPQAPIFCSDPEEVSVLSSEKIYHHFSQNGYKYGKSLQVLAWAKVAPGNVKAFLDVSYDWGFAISPALIDGGMQTAILLPELADYAEPDQMLVPFQVDEIKINPVDKGKILYCQCILNPRETNKKMVSCDLYFTDIFNQIHMSFKGLKSILINKTSWSKSDPQIATTRSETSSVKKYDSVICEEL